MHIHILGICGTFMGSLAVLAKELGHHVTGSDANVYPPMSTQLEAQGIQLMQGYLPEHLQPAPDLVVIGNALSRGNPAVEYVLLRFDGIYGTGPGQIPPGSTIEAATLTLSIFNPTVAPAAEIHDAAVSWSEASVTWNNYGGEAGVQPDEIGAFVASAPLSGISTMDVTSSIAR